MNILETINESLKNNGIFSKLILSSSSPELLTRCPFCGDSNKSSYHGHFYLAEKDNVIVYYCQRCTTTGLLNPYTLNLLGINDSFTKSVFIKYTNQFRKSYHKAHSDIRFFSNYNYEKNEILSEYGFKTTYIKKRLFLKKFYKKDLSRYKIVLSIKDFFIENDIKVAWINDYFLNNVLDKKYFGFLSNKGTKLILRRIDDFVIEEEKEKFKRYYSVKLTEENAVDSDYYIIKNTYNLAELMKSRFTIVMTEGIITLLNVYNRVFDADNKNIYIAVLNKDYINKVIDFAKIIGKLDFNIEIFSDSEVDPKLIKKQFKDTIFEKNVKIFKNALGGDFGEENIKVVKSDFI